MNVASKTDLADRKSNVDHLTVDLSKLINIVNNDITKKSCRINWLPKWALLILIDSHY